MTLMTVVSLSQHSYMFVLLTHNMNKTGVTTDDMNKTGVTTEDMTNIDVIIDNISPYCHNMTNIGVTIEVIKVVFVIT